MVAKRSVGSFLLAGLLVAYLAVLTWFGYGVYRTDFTALLTTFYTAFVLLAAIYPFIYTPNKWQTILFISVGIRVVLIGMIPNMSDDFYRFIWDGVLLAEGINPFEHLPSYYMEQTGGEPGSMVNGLTIQLFEGMNSPDYYTIYPPICQLIFWLGAGLFGGYVWGNVVVMRLFMILAEIATIWYLLKILRIYGRDERWALLYILNPVVIMELTGNLHFEAVMIAFLMSAFYYLLVKRFTIGFILLALAINTKLIPLIFMPYLAFSLGWRKTIHMSIIVGCVTLALHIPFYDLSFVKNFFSSIELYFQKFEFNASIYYIVRWIGYQVKGYNIIEAAGKHLAVYSTLLILIISWFMRDKKLSSFPAVVIFSLAGYYFLAPVVHPWYVTTLLVFVPLGGYFFPLVWSFMLPLTYHVYRTSMYEEILWFVAIEYAIVYFVFFVDIWRPDWYRNLLESFKRYCCKPFDKRAVSGHEITFN